MWGKSPHFEQGFLQIGHFTRAYHSSPSLGPAAFSRPSVPLRGSGSASLSRAPPAPSQVFGGGPLGSETCDQGLLLLHRLPGSLSLSHLPGGFRGAPPGPWVGSVLADGTSEALLGERLRSRARSPIRLLRVSEAEDSLEPAGHMWEK